MSFNIKVINMAKNQVLPIFKESRNSLWIDYGDNNLYPQYLLDVFHSKSNKHKAIISRKVMMTTGNGIEATTEQLKAFLANKWSDFDIEELSVKINYDLEIFGGFALNIRWNTDGTSIAAVDYLPFHKVRLSTSEDKVWLSKDWEFARRKENVPCELQKFSPKLAKEFPTQVFYFLLDTTGQEYYPIPSYQSSINWIELDWEISNFHLSSVRNGFMPGFILNFSTGIPTAEEMDGAYKEFEKKYTGTENANKFILTFSEGQDQKPELTPLTMNDSDQRFLLLHSELKNEIFIGHEVTSPQLFGITVPGELGGKDQLLESLAIFQSTYINYRQALIAKQLNKISVYAGVSEPIKFKRYQIDFSAIEINNGDNE